MIRIAWVKFAEKSVMHHKVSLRDGQELKEDSICGDLHQTQRPLT